LEQGRSRGPAGRDGIPGRAHRTEGREEDVTDHHPRCEVAVTAVDFDAAGRALLVKG
jgi:hypothetical protein